MTRHTHTYLALGDSYTTGEGVPVYESFAYQAVQLLRNKGYHFNAPEIMAQTGFTTFELAEIILHTTLQPSYDFVSLLIGVNNQYRGLPIDEYKTDLEFLIKKAIHLSGDNPGRVIILSIPDWGITPFAKDKDTVKIATEIDEFNEVVKTLAHAFKADFINVTHLSRQAKDDPLMVAEDGLHPSVKQYKIWAGLLADVISSKV